MKLSHIAISLCLLFTMQVATAGRTAPLVEKNIVLGDPAARTPAQMREYILHAADVFDSDIHYKVVSDERGALQLEFNHDNQHYVSVLFTYDGSGFKTNYVASKDLNYAESKGVRVIHPSYMNWMDDLAKAAKVAYDMQLNAEGDLTNPQAMAELTFRSTGATDMVRFFKWDETTECNDPEDIGSVSSWSVVGAGGREQEDAGWNARYNGSGHVVQPSSSPKSSVTKTVVALRTVRISGSSSISIAIPRSAAAIAADIAVARLGKGMTSVPTETYEKYSCGPTKYKFTPQGGPEIFH